MDEFTEKLSPGDWIVHRDYGAGQIEAVETIGVDEDDKLYYRVQGHDMVFWISLEQCDDEWVRPLATPDEIYSALDEIEKPARKLPRYSRARVARFKEIRCLDSPDRIARTVRDIWALRKRKRVLPMGDRTALERLMRWFLSEWSASTGIEFVEARERLQNRLDEHVVAA